MARPATTPLKITLHLADGRLNSTDGVVMLDGILYHAWFIKHAPHVLDGNGSETYDGHFGLPIRRNEREEYHASRAVYTETARTVETINKRPDFFNSVLNRYLADDKGLISSSVGEYRAYRMPNIIRTIADGNLTFWAMGHKDAVQELLNLIPAAGKKNAIGYGFIDRVTVEDVEEDYSFWHPEYGLIRPVPVEAMNKPCKSPVLPYRVNPPYWKSMDKKLCYVPIP